MRIIVTGSHGLIGTALVARLRRLGHDVVRLVRGAAGPAEISWDPAAGRLDPAALAGSDAVVHLAGAGIGDHRWTDEYKREILESRTRGTTLVAEAIAARDDGPAVLLCASGINVYGDRGDEVLDETSSLGDGFLADVVRAWEASTAPAAAAGRRVVNLRNGMVLSATAGGLKKMLPLFKLGLGGRFGSGRQWMSWISLEDELDAIVHLLDSEVGGPVNLTSPNPVTNREFAAVLGHVLRRPAVLPVPAFGPKLVVGAELAETLLFDSLRVVPRALTQDGFEHTHPDLESGLRAALGR